MPDDGLIPEPTFRHLRIYAFDPSVSSTLDTIRIGEITIPVRWEPKPELQPGPIGEYIEVIDVDPSSGVMYKPVDLNDPSILAQNGLAPSETNPQFHQQMVYAVAMTTIRHFEQALGRVALWSSERNEDSENSDEHERYVQRLRIYPHALRDRNAYYSPEKKALLFGYFPVDVKDSENTPGTMVFTCTSHDIVAHETTHALLDGVHPRFNEPMNADVLAFHEAFADIVALFQHFSYPGVLRDQIARTRGNLAGENLLAQLAQQFGKASGRGTSLRDALGQKNKKNEWVPRKPDVHALDAALDPHTRGAILVAAVFGAFLSVYKSRTIDLYRIATEGTGVLKEGEIHPDLANRLASEAARVAQQVLQMCIRAIDYCPPVGITFGDYLRAIVTADYDMNLEDSDNFRLAFVENFRRWGISPHGMLSMSVESLLWPSGRDVLLDSGLVIPGAPVPSPTSSGSTEPTRKDTIQVILGATDTDPAGLDPDTPKRSKIRSKPDLKWDLESGRRATWEAIDSPSFAMWRWLNKGDGEPLLPSLGLVAKPAPNKNSIYYSKSNPSFYAVNVQSVRSALRRSPRGGTLQDLVVEVTQRRRGYFDPAKQKAVDSGQPVPRTQHGDFMFRTGCTLLVNPKTMEVRRVIRTPGDITDDNAIEEMRTYLTRKMARMNAFDGVKRMLRAKEPFALLHREEETLQNARTRFK